MFKTREFQESLDIAVNSLEVLTEDEAKHFVQYGYVVVKGAFPEVHANEVSHAAWEELASDFSIDKHDPISWQPTADKPHGHGYVRTKGTGLHYQLRELAPRAFKAQADVIGGVERLPNCGEDLHWGNAVISNLGIEDDPRWEPPSSRQPHWHKDGWHFRHFMHSPEQGLLIVPLYSEIRPKSGGTVIARDSIKPVAKLLHRSSDGLHPDSVQGQGYLIPGLIEQCSDFVELTGQPGDVVLIHPYVLHRVAINPSTRARFIANMALVLKQPMSFVRTKQRQLSLVELAILFAIGESEYDFRAGRPLKAFKPFPFRDVEQKMTEHAALQSEMRKLAERGIVTPEWAPDYGYMSNREYAQMTT